MSALLSHQFMYCRFFPQLTQRLAAFGAEIQGALPLEERPAAGETADHRIILHQEQAQPQVREPSAQLSLNQLAIQLRPYINSQIIAGAFPNFSLQ